MAGNVLLLLHWLGIVQRMHPYQKKAKRYGYRACGEGYENGELMEVQVSVIR